MKVKTALYKRAFFFNLPSFHTICYYFNTHQILKAVKTAFKVVVLIPNQKSNN